MHSVIKKISNALLFLKQKGLYYGKNFSTHLVLLKRKAINSVYSEEEDERSEEEDEEEKEKLDQLEEEEEQF